MGGNLVHGLVQLPLKLPGMLLGLVELLLRGLTPVPR